MFFTSIFAGLGGLLPTLSRIATSYIVQPEQPLPHWHILIALLIFFLLGSILNIPFNRENDITKAIIIGISAPGLITNIVAGAANTPQSKLPQSAFLTPVSTQSSKYSGLFFVNTAFAQNLSPSPPSPLGSPTIPARPAPDTNPTPTTSPSPGQSSTAPQSVPVIFNSNLEGNYGYYGVVEEPLQIAFFGKDNLPYFTSVYPGNSKQVTVPFDPDKVTVSSRTSSSSSNIPKGYGIITIYATLSTMTSGGGDLAWALGKERPCVITQIDLRVSRITP